MFLRKSNSEKFFKCFQHISVKHRPSWNHLDLKQMRWLFSQQAFLLGGRARAGAGGWREGCMERFPAPCLWRLSPVTGSIPGWAAQEADGRLWRWGELWNYPTGSALSLTSNLISLGRRWKTMRTETEKERRTGQVVWGGARAEPGCRVAECCGLRGQALWQGEVASWPAGRLPCLASKAGVQ